MLEFCMGAICSIWWCFFVIRLCADFSVLCAKIVRRRQPKDIFSIKDNPLETEPFTSAGSFTVGQLPTVFCYQ